VNVEPAPTLEQLAQRRVSASARRALLNDGAARARIADELWSDSTYQRLAFGELFRGLEALPSPGPAHRGVGVRASNILVRNGLESWPSLAAASATSLQRLSNLGFKSFDEIIDVILIAWAEPDDLPVVGAPFGPTAPSLTVEPGPPAIADRDARALAEVLRWLWSKCGTRTFSEALSDAATIAAADLPPEIAASVDQLAASKLEQALSLPGMTTEDWAWLLEFDERTLEILERRVFTDERLTLDELACGVRKSGRAVPAGRS
jgi:hypothetical protein